MVRSHSEYQLCDQIRLCLQCFSSISQKDCVIVCARDKVEPDKSTFKCVFDVKMC